MEFRAKVDVEKIRKGHIFIGCALFCYPKFTENIKANIITYIKSILLMFTSENVVNTIDINTSFSNENIIPEKSRYMFVPAY